MVTVTFSNGFTVVYEDGDYFETSIPDGISTVFNKDKEEIAAIVPGGEGFTIHDCDPNTVKRHS